MDPQEIAEKIDWPLDDWPGNCFGVATKFVEEKIVKGKAVYGHYHGFISDESIFAGRVFTHHGWIVGKNSIIDPTRWVFENVEPYIFKSDLDNEDYDFGGNRVREQMMLPPPAYDKEQKNWKIPDDLESLALSVGMDIKKGRICAPQIGWLASMPLHILEDMGVAVRLYEWVANEVKFKAFVPLDNRKLILGE